MAAYIGRIQDADSNDVYPQTKVDGVIDLDQKFLSEAGDTDWTTEGFAFLNGAFDWGVKHNSNKDKYSGFRKFKVGDVDCVYLKIDLGINKTLKTYDPIIVAKVPEKVKLNGNNFFVGNNNVRWTIDSGEVNIFPEVKEIGPDTRLQLAISYIAPHK